MKIVKQIVKGMADLCVYGFQFWILFITALPLIIVVAKTTSDLLNK